jgi:hypothetical protein
VHRLCIGCASPLGRINLLRNTFAHNAPPLLNIGDLRLCGAATAQEFGSGWATAAQCGIVI